MNECRKIHPMLSQYLEGELSSKDKRLVAWHLNQCAAARKELYEVERLRKRLAELPEPPFPVRLHERIMDAVFRPEVAAREKSAGIPDAPRTFLPRFLLKPAWGVAAAAVVVLVVFNLNPDWMKGLVSSGTSLLQRDRRVVETSSPVLDGAELELTPVQGFPAEDHPEEAAGGLPGMEPPAVAPRRKDAPAPAPIGKSRVAEASEALTADGTKADSAKAPSVAPEERPVARTMKDRLTGLLAAAKKNETTKTSTPPPGGQDVLTSLAAEGAQSSASGEAAAQAWRAKGIPSSSDLSSLPRWSGANARSAVETQELISDAQVLKVYWTLLNPGEVPPPVDFETQAVVVLVSSRKPTAGWRVVVDRLEDAPANIVVWYREEAPEPEGFVAQVLTRPWMMQVVPRPAKPVIFKKKD